MATGFVAMIASLILYTQIPVHGSYWSDLLPGYLLMGFGLPFAFIPVSIAALAGVSNDEAGLASGLINTAQQIGGAVGVAVASSVAISHFKHLVSTGTSAPEALTSGYQWAFWVMVGVGIVGLIASLTLIRSDQFAPATEPAEASA
jgi:MFS family permease